MARFVLILASAAGMWLAFAFEPQSDQPHAVEYPTPLVREEIRIAINGVSEKWQLRWNSHPVPTCEANELSLACPCAGFAYGEAAELILTRSRGPIEIDRVDLTPQFKDTVARDRMLATVRRWEPQENDLEASQREDFPRIVAKRPVVRVMKLADYDHDGQQTEFFLQTSTAPCAKLEGIVVGVSKQNPKLHIFGTAENPKIPLVFKATEWEALRKASSPFEIEDWHCGDHASETQIVLWLGWTPKGIEGRRLEYSCPPLPKKLLDEKPL